MVSRKTRWILGIFFGLFVIFMYGPMLAMAVLSLQGPHGSQTFPAKELVSTHWYSELTSSQLEGVRTAIGVSVRLSLIVAAITAILSLMLGMAFRQRFRGSGLLFYGVLLSLMTPGILISLGLSLLWYYMGRETSIYTTALGVQVVWAIPFGFLVMTAVFNRYDARAEEAARDLGAGALTTFREVTLPIVWTGVFGAALFGFTLAWNEFERTFLVAGPTQTLPLEIFRITSASVLRPYVYSLGVLTTLFSFALIIIFLTVSRVSQRRSGASVITGDGGPAVGDDVEAAFAAGD